MDKYEFNTLEAKWRKYWDENPINPSNTSKPKYYCLDMFPYPSANGLHVGHWRGYVLSDVLSRYKLLQGYEVLHPMNGLHVGHWRGYVLSDVLSRYKLLQGYEVLHPMGWDAFGLPAENFAIKTGTHPSVATTESIKNVKRQLQEISAS